MRAGSLPTSGSVSRNALTWSLATRGGIRCFCSSVPNSRTGSGTPIDWWALSSTPIAEWPEEQLLAEARLLPVLLSRCLGNLAGLLLRDHPCTPAHGGHLLRSWPLPVMYCCVPDQWRVEPCSATVDGVVGQD